MESSFTDVEKRFVLAEMIKVSRMDVTVLVDFIRSHNVQPDWLSMQLPGGRNMHQCIRATENMFNTPFQPPAISPLKRRSFGDIGDHAPKKRALESPGESSPYALPRSINTQSPGIGQHPVNIQPRPNGYPPPTLTPSTPITPITHSVVLPPRRRGRPPKAESLARQSASQTYQPISPAPIAPSPVQPIAPRPSSPVSAYQVWSANPQEPKPKKRGRQSASDKQPPQEAVPRTVQGTPGSEADTRQAAGPLDYHDWRDRPPRADPSQPSPGPAPREQLPPMSSLLSPHRTPLPPFDGSVHGREPPTTTGPLEPTR